MAALRALAPKGLACAGGALDQYPGQAPLYAEEAAYISGARPKRRLEFVAGRTYARQALAQLGVPAQAIPASQSRAPRWPEGTLGSIAHTDAICMAVAARRAELAGVGLDIEGDDPLDAGLADIVCSPAERAALAAQAKVPKAPYCLLKLTFVAKEAVYKLYHPLVGHFLDFHDVEVSLDVARQVFRAQLTHSVPPLAGQRCIGGRFAHAGGLLIALTALSPSGLESL